MQWNKKTFIRIFGVSVIVLSAFGFLFKLLEFVSSLAKGDVINFAIVPVTVYLIVALGFFSLFIWSIMKGHLKNVEEPKYRMLEMEEKYKKMGF
jgi:Na+/phosphate symporter